MQLIFDQAEIDVADVRFTPIKIDSSIMPSSVSYLMLTQLCHRLKLYASRSA